jgi:ankyrin repeat protein
MINNNTNRESITIPPPPTAFPSKTGFVEITEFLVNRKAERHHKDCRGKTALQWARKNGHDDVVKILKQADALELNARRRGYRGAEVSDRSTLCTVLFVLPQT